MTAAGADDTVRPLAAALAAACRRLHARGLLAGAEGNLSLRLADGSLLITASGVDKGTIDGTQVVRLSSDGHMHGGRQPNEPGPERNSGDHPVRASSEVGMHLACYAARPDVQAIVHAHPPAATGFATAGLILPANVLPELPVVVGPVALVPYARPGTPALAAAMQPFFPAHEVFLLANHGVTAVGRSLTDAVLRMESVEQAARIVLVARVLGGERSLPTGEAAALASLHPARDLAGMPSGTTRPD